MSNRPDISLLIGDILEGLGNDYSLGHTVLPSEHARRRRLRRAVAHRLRAVANKLEPEHEITVHVRPVIVGQDELNMTVQILTEIERRKLGIYQPPSLRTEWTFDGK